jgi:hypothetical protein
MVDRPHGHVILGIEGEIEEGRKVAEELWRKVLGLVHDPNLRRLLGVGQFADVDLVDSCAPDSCCYGFQPKVGCTERMSQYREEVSSRAFGNFPLTDSRPPNHQ